MASTAAEGSRVRAPAGERDEQAQDRPSGSRGRAIAVLLCLVVVQLAWLAALTYGAYSLLR
jgi:hypothetical protein